VAVFRIYYLNSEPEDIEAEDSVRDDATHQDALGRALRERRLPEARRTRQGARYRTRGHAGRLGEESAMSRRHAGRPHVALVSEESGEELFSWPRDRNRDERQAIAL
jgi:hypothetical protein